MASEALDLFIFYSHRDEELKDELINLHLKPLKRDGKITTWQDRDIEAGTEWAEEIKTNLEKADIVLLLITRHFLASDYCYETEMQRAVQRHNEGSARVIPIILAPCTWEDSPFSQFQVLPKDGKAVTSWDDQHEAFVDVEQGIRWVVDSLNAERRQATESVRAEAERQGQQTAEAQIRQQRQSGMSRRRALQVAGLGGGGLIFAMATNSLLTGRLDNGLQVAEYPLVLGSSPDDLSTVDIQAVTVDARGNITERSQGQVSAFREDLGNNIGLDMVAIPAGEVVMGSPPDEEGREKDEGPQRTVNVSSFYMGRFQVTQAQYKAVMGKNPSKFKGANRPVEQVSWDDAIAFCEKLWAKTGRIYRLPSEAEWEHACRAGTTAPFHFGSTITPELANYDSNYAYALGSKSSSRGETTDVGSFPPNAFGLHDMHGNVWDWCQDVWHDSYEGAPTDGSAWVEGGEQEWRLRRGGSWYAGPRYCRLANRGRIPHYGSTFETGFRVVYVSSWPFLWPFSR
jgi:formylglycine-generating enzyme required for sulfatase activity